MPKVTEEQIVAAAREIDPSAFLTLREVAANSGMDVENPPEGVVFSEQPDEPLLMNKGRRDAAIDLAKRIAVVFGI